MTQYLVQMAYGSGWALLSMLLLCVQALAASCTITATAAGFGVYDETLNDSAIATISGSCSRGAKDTDMTSSTITLSAGVGGTYAPRKMANGANRLNYNLFVDAARSVVWGDSTAGTSTVNALPLQKNGMYLNPNATRNFSFTTYGRIPASQSVPTGNYTDTITVTLIF